VVETSWRRRPRFFRLTRHAAHLCIWSNEVALQLLVCIYAEVWCIVLLGLRVLRDGDFRPGHRDPQRARKRRTEQTTTILITTNETINLMGRVGDMAFLNTTSVWLHTIILVWVLPAVSRARDPGDDFTNNLLSDLSP
jgi:hypothetical protein